MRTDLLPTRALHRHGLGRRDIARALADGTLSRVRRGWYATPDTVPVVVTAGRVGGRLTCLEALRLHGAWILDDGPPHVRVASGVAVRAVPGVHIHWTPERVAPGLDPLEDALLATLECADLRATVVAVDSLVNRRLITPSRLRAILGGSARGRLVLALHDPAAESGGETLLRLGLRRLRIRARSQVVIPGVGRVDFLVGDRLVIEVDGFEWHGSREAFERDRDRDRELVRRGYVVLRPSHRRVTTDLDTVLVAVRDIVRRRDHRWRAVHRTRLSAEGYLVDLSSTKGTDPES